MLNIEHNTRDLLGQETMYQVYFQWASPKGLIRNSNRWTLAKDEKDAENQIADLLKSQKIPWFKITKIRKLN